MTIKHLKILFCLFLSLLTSCITTSSSESFSFLRDPFDLGMEAYNSVKFLTAADRFEQALFWDKFGSHDENVTRDYYWIGKSWFGYGDCDKAEEAFEAGLEVVKNNTLLEADLLTALAECYVIKGREDEAELLVDEAMMVYRGYETVAGAKGVLSTLWQVDDEATRVFMVRMYELVQNEGYSYLEAVNQVKREFIKSEEYSHPYYWAPFVFYGDGDVGLE